MIYYIRYDGEIPGTSKNWLTSGKLYLLLSPLVIGGEVIGGDIMDDTGERIHVCIKQCSFLGGREWDVYVDRRSEKKKEQRNTHKEKTKEEFFTEMMSDWEKALAPKTIKEKIVCFWKTKIW